jgi:serine/threonine protein kinase
MLARDDLTHIAQGICQKYNLRFQKKVGEGGFKQTFHIINPTQTHFALKIYHLASGFDRIKREIEAMTRCHHPCIAQIYAIDIFPYNGQQYLFAIEEYLAGGTLTDRLIINVTLDRPIILSLGRDLIDAVGHIATLGLVHRDLKPDNILFRDGTYAPVITDFGIVRDLKAESITATWVNMGPGTRGYAAPEQLNNEKHLIDWRTDQFSCGVLLSLSAFGIHPFDYGDDTINAMAGRAQPIQTFYDLADRYNLQALKRMVEPWPVKRFRSVQDLMIAWRSQGV